MHPDIEAQNTRAYLNGLRVLRAVRIEDLERARKQVEVAEQILCELELQITQLESKL